MLDPQRNLLTVILVAGIGALGLAAAILAFVLGRANIDDVSVGASGQLDEVEVDVPETGLAEFNEYSTIMERPVFFSDRRLPVVEVADESEEDDEDIEEFEEEEEVADLEAVVAGIVITPEMKLAMINDQTAKKTMVLREGMSLEGEQAAWKLESILPRGVSFVSVDGRQTDLELKVHTSGLDVGTAPPASRQRQEARRGGEEEQPEAPEQQQTAEQASDEARARAEEIRRRVAERRAELRAEAERRARQQQRQDNDG